MVLNHPLCLKRSSPWHQFLISIDEYKMFDEVFKDIRDISGPTVPDTDPEGVASRHLAERTGDGRIVETDGFVLCP